MEIKAGAGYPAGDLSNFAPHKFIFREHEVASMEGLLQGFKCKNPAVQLHALTLVGRAAKYFGKPKPWWKDGLLYWQGRPFNRFSEEYQQTLDEAYWSLFTQNDKAKRALLASGMPC